MTSEPHAGVGLTRIASRRVQSSEEGVRIRRLLVLLLALVASRALAVELGGEGTPASASSCEWCHEQLGDPLSKPVAGFRNDAHKRHGMSCATCHGGDPGAGFDGDAAKAMDPRKGYIGVPAGRRIVELCARCHSDIVYMRNEKPGLPTDQERLYYTSVHGKRLLSGDTKVAVCSSCHQAHGILPATDPESSVYPTRVAETCGRCHGDRAYMSGYDLPTDQLEQWSRSVHAEALLERNDLGAPTCNDCHGNHGAVPPGVSHVSRVCGQCHPANDEYFQASPHKAAYARLGIAECEFCHGNHEVRRTSDEMVGTSEGAVCLACHRGGSRGYQAAYEIRSALDSLRTLTEKVAGLAGRADRAGGFVEEVRFALQEAATFLKRARTLVHTFDPDRVVEEVKLGLVSGRKAEAQALQVLGELRERRIGLAGFLILIVGVIALLLVEIRKVDRKRRAD